MHPSTPLRRSQQLPVSTFTVAPYLPTTMADFDIFLGDFQFTDFHSFVPNPIIDPSMQGLPQPTHYALPPNYGSPTSPLSPITQFDQSAKRRKLEAPETPQAHELSIPNDAEEDKRRRNTAASARFRVKKKQREQALEKTAKEKSDRANLLEQKVQDLERENAWLKTLIVGKEGGKEALLEFKAVFSKPQEASGRSSSTHTDGVGTSA